MKNQIVKTAEDYAGESNAYLSYISDAISGVVSDLVEITTNINAEMTEINKQISELQERKAALSKVAKENIAKAKALQQVVSEDSYEEMEV